MNNYEILYNAALNELSEQDNRFKKLQRKYLSLQKTLQNSEQNIENLQRELNQKDKVIKEAIDYIKSDNSYLGENDDASDWYLYETGVGQDILEILERTDK